MRNFTAYDMPQRSPEWYAIRLGRLTGSCAGEMLAKIKSGEAAGRRNLRLRLVLERLTKRSQDSEYISPAMQAGIDREADAFVAYEAVTGIMALRSGFLAHTEHLAGCSLDGHVGDFAQLVSLKCRQPAAHWECLKSGSIPTAAFAQMRHELWITGAADHHYFSWNPDFPPTLQSRLVTLARKHAEIPAYEDAALTFLKEVETELDALSTVADLSGMLTKAVVCV